MKITRENAYNMVGGGWKSLIDQVYDKLAEFPDVYIETVKEKWGGLRIYHNKGYIEGEGTYSPEFERFLVEIENKSFTVCEVCGDPGEPRRGSWILTLCDTHKMVPSKYSIELP